MCVEGTVPHWLTQMVPSYRDYGHCRMNRILVLGAYTLMMLVWDYGIMVDIVFGL